MSAFSTAFRATTILSVIPLLLSACLLASCSSSPRVGGLTPMVADEETCEVFECEGDFVAGITWNDARGENAFLVTETRNEVEDGMVQTIRAYRFVLLPEENIRRVWQTSKTTENICDEGQGLVGDLELTDLNEDGVGEVTMVYNIEGNCDVSPMTYGLMLHTGVGEGLLEMNGQDDAPHNTGIPGTGEIERSGLLSPETPPFGPWADSVWHARVNDR